MLSTNYPGADGFRDPEEGRCPGGPLKKFLQPCLLLLLRQKPAYGYELIESLTEFGLEAPDPGTVYRNLRRLEEDGLVESHWDTSGSGPPRRFYKLTGEGEDMLRAWVVTIRKNKELLEGFLRRYAEVTGEDV